MGEFMLENVCQFGGHRTEATDGNPQLPIIHRAGPARRVRDIEESLLGIKRYENIVARRSAEIPDKVVIVRFEGCNDLSAQGFGCLFALVVKGEMLTLALRKLRFDVLFALCFVKKLFHRRIGSEFKRMLPRRDRFLGMVGSEKRISQHCVRVRRFWSRAHGPLGVGNCLARIPGADKHSRVIDKDRRVVGLKAKSTVEILFSLSDIAVIEFEFAGYEVRRRAELYIPFSLKACQPFRIYLSFFNDFAD